MMATAKPGTQAVKKGGTRIEAHQCGVTLLALRSQLGNRSLNQSQESGVACPRNHFHYNSLTIPV